MAKPIPFDELGKVFRGSDAVAAGLITPGQLRGPHVQRLFRDVFVPQHVRVTHALRCAGVALSIPEGTITGRSAATLRGVRLARTGDPVELVVPLDSRVRPRDGLALRYTDVAEPERAPWGGAAVATPMRTALDLLLSRGLPEGVADLDAVLRANLVAQSAVTRMVQQRTDHGIVLARQAAALADPRAESRPESKVRVWLALDGLHPEPQYWIEDDRGRVARVDLAFPPQRVAVEYEGGWHGGQWALTRDRDRLNRVQEAGWTVVFVTAEQLRDPARMVALIRAALARAT